MLELAHLLKALLSDPRSRLHAAVAGWSHPLEWGDWYQLDLIDVLLMRWSKDGAYKPVPRPSDPVKKKTGKSPQAALRQLRPHLFKDES